ncbi:phage Gp37/Gp68 family protein [Nocardia rhizosphaerae]|uniref:Phage Gp37/Gp68 family protein n=1 Tax=Nocardia rhizosphaerae TaxID=1691571 RepID=A0ABV8LEY1_9NOCA
MGKTSIEWAEYTWNPVTGCDKVSPGCDHCYAEGIAHRFAGTPQFPNGFGVTLRPERLGEPLRWRKPQRVFVNSMSDLFHADVPDEFIAKVFGVMAHAEQHTFQVLTKRPGRMRSLLRSDAFRELVFKSVDVELPDVMGDAWPIPNVWLGVSAEDQKWADVRIPVLLDTPATVRFVSAEPLLGPVDLAQYLEPLEDPSACGDEEHCSPWSRIDCLHWVIVGGESGRGARPMHPDWVRSLRDQCVEASVPFLFKQWGEYVTPDQMTEDAFRAWDCYHAGERRDRYWRLGKKAAGRELDEETWDEYPKEIR